MVRYAQLSPGGRIISISTDATTGGTLFTDDAIYSNPASYKYSDDTWNYSPQPSPYHSLDVNGNWIVDNSVLANAQTLAWSNIKAYREYIEDGGIQFTISGQMHWFHTDIKSLVKYVVLLIVATIFAAQYPQTLQWKSMDSEETVTMTSTSIINLFFAIFARFGTLYTIGRNHKTAMLAAADPLLYNYKTGWPAIYED